MFHFGIKIEFQIKNIFELNILILIKKKKVFFIQILLLNIQIEKFEFLIQNDELQPNQWKQDGKLKHYRDIVKIMKIFFDE
jgi:hypothetical protein